MVYQIVRKEHYYFLEDIFMNNLENNLGNAELNEEELDMVSGGATYLKTGLVAFEETVSVGRLGGANKFDDTGNLTKPTTNFQITKAHY